MFRLSDFEQAVQLFGEAFCRGYNAQEDFHSRNICKSLRAAQSCGSSYLWIDSSGTTRVDSNRRSEYRLSKVLFSKLFQNWNESKLPDDCKAVLTQLQGSIIRFCRGNTDNCSSVDVSRFIPLLIDAVGSARKDVLHNISTLHSGGTESTLPIVDVADYRPDDLLLVHYQDDEFLLQVAFLYGYDFICFSVIHMLWS